MLIVLEFAFRAPTPAQIADAIAFLNTRTDRYQP